MNWWVIAITFIGVNLDFFFILLLLLQKFRLTDVIIGYLIGVLILVSASFFAGQILSAFLPEWLLGVLGLWPIWMAIHDDDDDPSGKSKHAPWLTVLTTYLSVCTGCNLSIFLPVLTKASFNQFLAVLAFVGSCTILVVCLLKLVGSIPTIKTFMTKYSEILTKIIYIGVGLYVFWDSGLIAHLMNLI